MNSAIPEYVSLIFTFTTLFGVWLFKKAFKPKPLTWLLLFFWLAVQGLLAYSGLYQDNTTLPPKFIFVLAPPLLFIAALFITLKGRIFMDDLDLENLHWIHTIRIPIEIILYLLFVAKTLPEAMTFGGKNLDIIAGLTAPLIVLYGIRKPILSKNRMLLWNIICLFLLLNIVGLALFSIETPFQQLHFDIPTTGVLGFPFVWLPCFIVPMVLFGHLVSIRRLLKS